MQVGDWLSWKPARAGCQFHLKWSLVHNPKQCLRSPAFVAYHIMRYKVKYFGFVIGTSANGRTKSTKPINKHMSNAYIRTKSRHVWHLMLINKGIPLETYERTFIVITNRQLDLPGDLETSAAHATLYWTEHIWGDNKSIKLNLCLLICLALLSSYIRILWTRNWSPQQSFTHTDA